MEKPKKKKGINRKVGKGTNMLWHQDLWKGNWTGQCEVVADIGESEEPRQRCSEWDSGTVSHAFSLWVDTHRLLCQVFTGAYRGFRSFKRAKGFHRRSQYLKQEARVLKILEWSKKNQYWY